MGQDFFENLKAARLAAKMSQKEVAEKAGVAKSTYSQYESGARLPSVEVVKRIAMAVGVSADILLNTQQGYQELWLTADDTAFMLMYKQLNEEGKRKVREYADDIFLRYKDV